ncbi:hypothetical protein [Actinoplanes philippinensis]|uniref:hypothetical protein n=1 Tax=Actinoplanes philippinensis TaxID=35752 RepID=UPI0033E0DB05
MPAHHRAWQAALREWGGDFPEELSHRGVVPPRALCRRLGQHPRLGDRLAVRS